MANLATVKAQVAAADQAQGTGGLLTRKVDAAVSVMLQKKVNPNRARQVLLVVDRSGSMATRWGQVPEAVYRALGFAVIVDDDGNVPTAFFDHSIEEVVVELKNFHGIVERHRISPRGSTDLAAALRRVAGLTGNGDLFARGGGSEPTVRKASMPAFVMIVTDGQPDDRRAATDAIRRLSYRGVFLKFIFVGTDQSGWAYLQSLDDDIPVGVPYSRGGRLVDNVDAKQFDSLAGMDDKAFYEAMLDELPTWDQAATAAGLI